MLFDLVGQVRRLFLHLGLGLLRSEVRLRQRQGPGRETLLGQPFDGLFLVGGIDRGSGLGWGLYRRQSLALRNQCIHSFSIIGGPWL